MAHAKPEIMKRTYAICLLALFALLVLPACKKKSGNGYLTVKMTDDPADYDSVNVEIIGTEIHYSGPNSGWTTLPTVSGIYNLLDLQNNVTTILVNPYVLPEGKVQQMRLILGTQNSVVVDSVSYPLELSSQTQNGIKIQLNTTINSGDSLEILLDFDAHESVVEQGNNVYKLKPVVDLEGITFF